MTKKPPSLRDARLKIEWAETYFVSLEAAIGSFNLSNPYLFFEDVDTESGETLVKVRVTSEVPTEIQRLAELIATNLRSALDYMVCQLSLLNKRDIAGVEFPIAKGRDEFESPGTQRKIKKISPQAQAEIKRLEPYKGGQNSGLWALNELRRKGVHHFLIPMGHSTTMFGPGEIKAGEDGRVSVNLPQWSAPDEEPTILRFSGSGHKYNINFAVDICLAEIDGFERQPIAPFLRQSIDFVRHIIDVFDLGFFPKS